MNAYYDMIKSLMILFLCLGLFSLPSMYIFSRSHALADYQRYSVSQFTLGNLGKFNISLTPFSLRWCHCPVSELYDGVPAHLLQLPGGSDI